MHILYLAQQYDYADPSRGHSFEHYNFYRSLAAMGHELTYFDYPTEVATRGRSAANARLKGIALSDKPDVLFGVVRGDLIDKRIIRHISENTDTTTINWYCDDHWQYETLARKWTPCFNYVATTSQTALTKYRRDGLTNVIKSQWGADTTTYTPTPGPMQYDVTFVGQPYGIRREAIDALRRAGIDVRAWGNGWPGGKLDQAAMIRVFGQSRINLNFADASNAGMTRLGSIATSHLVRSMRDKPVLWRAWDGAQRLARWSMARAQRQAATLPRQIKGRVFEVPACGGFLLTQSAEDMADYLKPGRDCVTFETLDELVDVTRYYLKRESERAAIAEAGYQRTCEEHSWARRLTEVFREAGVAVDDAEASDTAGNTRGQASDLREAA